MSKLCKHFYTDDRKDPVIGDFTALPLNTKKDGFKRLTNIN